MPTESKSPSLKFEALLRLVLAEQDSPPDVKRTSRGVIDHAREQRRQFEERERLILTSGGGTYPECTHLFAFHRVPGGHFNHIERSASSAWSEF